MNEALGGYVARLMCGWIGRNTQLPSPPDTIYLAAFTSDGEVVGGSYERVPLVTGKSGTGSGSSFSVEGNRLHSAVDIVFPVATKNWGTVREVALMDAPRGGNSILQFRSISIPVEVNDQLRFPAGKLSVSVG